MARRAPEGTLSLDLFDPPPVAPAQIHTYTPVPRPLVECEGWYCVCDRVGERTVPRGERFSDPARAYDDLRYRTQFCTVEHPLVVGVFRAGTWVLCPLPEVQRCSP